MAISVAQYAASRKGRGVIAPTATPPATNSFTTQPSVYSNPLSNPVDILGRSGTVDMSTFGITPRAAQEVNTTFSNPLPDNSAVTAPTEKNPVLNIDTSVADKAKKDAVTNTQNQANSLLSGKSAAEEALIASLDPAKANLMSNFADQGATGAGALNSMLLNQTANMGKDIAAIRLTEQKKGFDQLMSLLENPNISPEEAGVITSKALQMSGIDTSSIPRLTDRERFETKYLKEKGYTKTSDGKYVDSSGADVSTSVKTVIDNYVNSSMGLDFSGKPITAVNDPNKPETYAADPFGTDTISAARGGNRAAITTVVNEAKATGDYSYLKDLPTSDPLYAESVKGISKVNTSSSKTSNRWDDLKYFSAYGSEDEDGNVTYKVGERFNDGGNIWEITGQGYDYNGDGQIYMMAKNLVTGEVKKYEIK